jgi:C-terminal processing protease CtpA/Prc
VLGTVVAGALLAVGLSGCAAQHGTIGAVMGQTAEGRLFVREVPDGLAADKAGLEPDDEVLLIEGVDVRTMSVDDVHRALGGTVGDPVRLTVLRGDAVLRVSIPRTPARKRAPGRAPDEQAER